MSELIKTSQTDGILTVTINRPERMNAFDGGTIEALRSALTFANSDDTVGAVVLTGAGDRAFSAGKDLEDNTDMTDPDVARAAVDNLQDLTRLIASSPKIFIAAVNGWAVGGGFELALNCDLSIWAESAAAFMPELKWGLYPSGASTVSIARRAGAYTALEMLLLGEKVPAKRLKELGLAWRVVDDGTALVEAERIAATVLQLPKARVADFKAAVNSTLYGELETTLREETRVLLASLADPETARRIAEFSR